jgi:hypothetical protein
MKKTIYLIALAFMLICTVFPAAAQGGQEKSSAGPSVKDESVDTDEDGIPDAAEKLLGTNPYAADTDGDGILDRDDEQALQLAIPFDETSEAPLPVKLIDARTEDNYHADDHLEITLQNTGNDTLGGLETYFTITDNKTVEKESYYVKLDAFSIPPGEKRTLHFDNQRGEGHYPGNTNGLYGNSANGLTFNVLMHTGGFAPFHISVKKDPGTAEIAD